MDLTWRYYERGDDRHTTYWLDRCAEAWGRLTDKRRQADLAHLRGIVAIDLRDDYEAAAALYKEALAIFHEINDPNGCSRVLIALGNLERDRGAYDAAEQHYLEALQTKEAAGVKDGLVVSYVCLGVVACDRERWPKASEWYQKALSLARQLRDQRIIADAQHGLARVHEAQGHPELALPLAEEALAIWERLRRRELPVVRKFVETLRAKVHAAPPP